MKERHINSGQAACMLFMLGLAWQAATWAESSQVLDHLFQKGFAGIPAGLLLLISPSIVAYGLAVYLGLVARRSHQ
jgi:hypothetical protein